MGNANTNNSDTSAVEILTEALANINRRRSELLRELTELDASLRSYGMDPRRFAGASASTQSRPKVTHSLPDAEDATKRRRRPAPSVKWVVEQLSEGEKSQPELARRATESGFSNTGVVAVLKKHEGQFAWERATRSASQRGMAPIIWSLRD